MRRLLVVLVAGAVALAACGGGGGSSGATAKAPVQLTGPVNDHGTKQVRGHLVTIEAGDYYFSPTYVQASPGETLQVEVRNVGSATHTFTIASQHVDEVIGPGRTATVSVTMPRTGSLPFECRFHAQRGMQGAFFVR